MVLAIPASLWAQEVNRKKYPDFTWELNPNPSLMVLKKSPEAQRAGLQRPTHVNNAELKFFPPVFNQDGGSCGSASRIRYMFTYELNAFRNLNGTLDTNNYPTHFVWLLTYGNSGKDEFVQHVGVPSAATYGGRTYSTLFGNQDTENNYFGWMTGYDKWFEAMHNRMLRPSNFPVSVATEEGREAVKNWIWNHNGDNEFYGGGICGIGVASGGEWKRIPQTAANDAAGVTGKYFVNKWGTRVDHALTIVGYDDRIEFDLNGNGIYGEKSADEVGAWIIVNSWGEWCNKGFIYCPYAYAGAWFKEDGTFGDSWWSPEIYQVRKNYRPLRTIKLRMDYSRRSEMCLSAGVSSDLNATAPERTVTFEHFKYAGDGAYGNTNPAPEVPMLGKWADGKMHTEPMEFGYDLTDLSAGFDKNMPLKYFFIVETRSWGLGSGHIYDASIIDYEYDESGLETPFNLPTGGTTITSAGNKTIISTIVYGHGYYAPQNLSYANAKLSWGSPISSGHEVTAYNIYREGIKIGTVDGSTTTYATDTETEQVTYAVSAVYGDAGVESAKTKVNTPIQVGVALNTSLNLKRTGLTIPDVFSTKYQDATIEFWIKPTSLSDWNQSAGSWGSFMFHANSNGAFTVGWNTGGHRVEGNSGDLQTNTWKHVAIVVQGNTLTSYINGIKKGSVTSTTYSGLGGFGNLVLGGSDNGAWNAYVDEFRIWNYARSATQILAGKNQEFVGSRMPQGLLAYYRGTTFEQDGVTYLRDYVGGHHAPIAVASKASMYRSTQPSVKSPTDELTAIINDPTGTVYAGIPVTLTSACSDAAIRTLWTAPGAGIEQAEITSPVMTFATTGNQQVTLTAYDATGASVTATKTISVQSAPAADATFTPTLTEVPTGDRVTFIAKSPALGYQYEWSMPGAVVESAQTANASATYNKAGSYTVTLKVSAPGGITKTSSQVIKVIDVAPVSAFSVSPAVVIKGEPFFLKDASTHGPTSWQWNLHSSAQDLVVIGQNSSVVPTKPGIYDITLTTRNAAGIGSFTQERALTVCNADSRNGLNFGASGASATAKGSFLETGQTAFTLEWWMNPTNLTTYCGGLGDAETSMLVKTDASGITQLYLNGKSSATAEGFVIPGEWHHYAIVYSKPKTYFYRDGQQIAMKAQNTTLGAPLTSFTIGGPNTPFGGNIDELRLWKVARSVDDIRATANAPLTDIKAAEAAGLVFYYDFNQSGGDVADRTSHGYDAVRNGFGPDGDAWGLSKGVFSLNFDEPSQPEDITGNYLKNYEKSFAYDASTITNATVANRFYAIKDWTLAGVAQSGNVKTGVHVDVQKNNCFTCTTEWDGFATSLSDHQAYQTITLPAGSYAFTAYYDETYEGQCGNSYLVVAESNKLPTTAQVASQSIAYKAMDIKSSTITSNTVEFTLAKQSTVSLGLLINMSGKQCMAIKKFELTRKPVTVIEADNLNGYDLTVDGTGYASLYLPFATVIPDGVTAYTASSVNGNMVELTELTEGILPAATGVVLTAEPGKYHFEPVTTSVSQNSILVGSATAWSPMAGKKYFSLGLNGDEVGFYPMNSTTLAPYEAYLEVSASGAQSSYITNVFPTAIIPIIRPENKDEKVYDLSGRRVFSPAVGGVYIKSGKKVMVK